MFYQGWHSQPRYHQYIILPLSPRICTPIGAFVIQLKSINSIFVLEVKLRQGKIDLYFDVVRVFLIEWVCVTEGAAFSSQESCRTWAASVLFCLFQRSYSTFVHMYICVRRVCAHECGYLQRPEEGAGFPRARIPGGSGPNFGSSTKTVHTLNH